MSLRKISKNRSVFLTEEAVNKLLHLALNNTRLKWTLRNRHWNGALKQFTNQFKERMKTAVEDYSVDRKSRIPSNFLIKEE
jgi:transposase-like protein